MEWFQWSETVFKILKVATISLYVKVAANGSAVPVFESESVPARRRPVARRAELNGESFVPGRPPAAKFAIAGVESCPKSEALRVRVVSARARAFHFGFTQVWVCGSSEACKYSTTSSRTTPPKPQTQTPTHLQPYHSYCTLHSHTFCGIHTLAHFMCRSSHIHTHAFTLI